MSYSSSVREELESLLELGIKETKKENLELLKQIDSLMQKNEVLQQTNEELKSEIEKFQKRNYEVKSESKTPTSKIEELTDKLCDKPKRFTHMEQFNGLQTPAKLSYLSIFFKLYFDYTI